MKRVTSGGSAGTRPTEHPLPPKPSRGALFMRNQNGKGCFTQNAIFIRFCISFIFVRFLMNEPDGYVFAQNAIAYPSFYVP